MSLLMSSDNPMNPRPFPLRPPSGNDVLDEIDAAHEQLSPAAKQAVGMSGLPQRMESAAAPAPASAPAMPSPAPVEQTPRLISRPAPARSLTPNPKMEADAAKVASLEASRPGVDTIHNPVLRTLGKIGDVAGTMFLGGNMALIPGTTLHHQRDLNQAREAYKGSQEAANDEANREHLGAQTELAGAQTAEADARTGNILNPQPSWKESPKAEVDPAHPELGPQTVFYNEHNPREKRYGNASIAATPVDRAASIDAEIAEAVMDEFKAGRNPMESPKVKQLMEVKQGMAAPKEQSRDDKAIAIKKQEILDKANAEGKPITDQEAYMQAYNWYVQTNKIDPGVRRAEIFVAGRTTPVFDRNGNLTFANPNEINANKGDYSPAAQAVSAEAKNAIFRSMYYTVGQARKAFQELGTMDAETRAQLAYAMQQTDPRSAVSSFMHGAVGSHMNDKQREVVQSMLSLAEDAMTLRSVAGMGQGSDELRAAITATIPSGKVPDVKYAISQLDKFEQLARRLHEGVPGTAANPKQGGGNNGGGSVGAPPVGTVVNGYRYKGGNHRDQASWEKVK